MDDIVIRIRYLIDLYGYSCCKFADMCGINRQTLYKCINGRVPSVELLQKILSAYPDISAEWLLMGEGEMKKHVLETLIDQLNKKDEQIMALIGDVKL